MKKRIISTFLILAIVFGCIPICALAEPNADAAISIEDVSAAAGEVVEVNVIITNNPGVAGATFTLSYPTDLTLLDAASGPAFAALDFTKPGTYTSPCNFVWDSENSEAATDGTILTLKFKISDEASSNQKFNVSLSYRQGDVFNDTGDISLSMNNGYVIVLDYIPGDVYRDGSINSKDTRTLRQYIAGGYNVAINVSAADVNDDGSVNAKDTRLIRRYIAGGYGVKLLPSTPRCAHTMEPTAAKTATCTEDGNIAYWHCTQCNKYYEDAEGGKEIALSDTVLEAIGHTVIIDPAVAATTEHTGLTEGSHCAICLQVLTAQMVTPKLEKKNYSITYHVANNDAYLAQQNVNNPNPGTYNSEDGLQLDDLLVTGYNFKGWYTAQTGGTRVTEIPKGNTGNKTLYAQWEKIPYKITFDSKLLPRDSIIRTIDEGVSIADLEMSRYKFMGWTDDKGSIVTYVSPGTENITLHANWVSYRNQTISNDYMSKGPITIEDKDNGQYLFVFDIGKIINVPLYTIKDFGNTTSGIIRVESESITNSISSTTAKEITETIADSTTNSATWTLSKDWNDLVTNTEDFTESQLREENILVSDGWGRTNSTTDNTGTVMDTGTLERDNTTTKDLTTTKEGASLGGGISTGKSLSPVNIDIKAELHADETNEDGTITDDGTDTYNLTHTNNLKSKTYSSTVSHSEETSQKIAEQASKQWGYSISKSTGGNDSRSENSSNTQSHEAAYSTTFSYTVAQEQTTVKEYSTASAAPGWHRLVCAGTVHVFAVVGFDVATHTYFYYTYSALDDATSEFYDYSAVNGEYTDYETGVLPFEVPISLHEYISERVYRTNGLVIDDNTGFVIEYEGDSEYVNIPDYLSVDNLDGTFDTVKVIGIAPDAFRNNTTIKAVRLSNYITEIPGEAFSGCTSLKFVEYNALSKIGTRAFAGCVSLNKNAFDTNLTELGANAFEDVPEIELNAVNAAVANAGVSSGAKKLTVNLLMQPEEMTNVVLTATAPTEELTINGFRNTYENLAIVSDAAKTNINGITFAKNVEIPLCLSSGSVSLYSVNISQLQGLAMHLKADRTSLVVNGTNSISTDGEVAILAKDITISKAVGSSIKCVLQVTTGDFVIGGDPLTESDLRYLDAANAPKYVTQEEYANMLAQHSLLFDANGGNVSITSKLVAWNLSVGELPVPTKDGYSFEGWFTDPEGGTQITAQTRYTGLADQTVYAHWIRSAFTVSLDANGGIVDSAHVVGYCGIAIGDLPIPTCDYYTFDGWYTERDDGTRVEASTVFTDAVDITLYAHWSLNASSGWVLASKVPADAQIIGEKWTYTKTETTESSNSSMSGWTQTGSYWSKTGSGSVRYASFPSGFDTSHWIYTSFAKNPYSTSDNGSTKREVSNWWSGFVYYKWDYNAPYSNRTDRAVSPVKLNSGTSGYAYWYFHANLSSKDHPYLDNYYCNDYNMPSYNCSSEFNNSDLAGPTPRFFRFNYYTSEYTDYQKIYQYHKVTDGVESSSEVSAGGQISNVQHWVTYRAK